MLYWNSWSEEQRLRGIRKNIVEPLKQGEEYEFRTTLNIYDDVPGQIIKIGEFANALWNKYVEANEKI